MNREKTDRIADTAFFIVSVIIIITSFAAGYYVALKRHVRSIDGVRADTVSVTTTTIHRTPALAEVRDLAPISLPLIVYPPTPTATRETAAGPPLFIDTACKDTPRVVVPITQKVYRDSDYTAYVSGYRQSLDSITVRSKVTTITRTMVRRPRLNFGITIGAGYGAINKKPDVFIGIGATYRLAK